MPCLCFYVLRGDGDQHESAASASRLVTDSSFDNPSSAIPKYKIQNASQLATSSRNMI
jgi:uncharacterized tellurite resistance protein B-like protein